MDKTKAISKFRILQIRLDQFQSKVIRESKPVLLVCSQQDMDFSQQLIVLEAFHKVHGKDLKVVLLDPDGLQAFARKFSIRGTPTFCLFKKGKVVDRFLGQANYADLERFLSRTLHRGKPVSN